MKIKFSLRKQGKLFRCFSGLAADFEEGGGWRYNECGESDWSSLASPNERNFCQLLLTRKSIKKESQIIVSQCATKKITASPQKCNKNPANAFFAAPITTTAAKMTGRTEKTPLSRLAFYIPSAGNCC
jgi:hypothetical protein